MMARVLKNIDNEKINVEVIRYFINNDNEYLIYSLNEIDNSGYTKLYASKIIGTKACIITDDEEWNLIKQIIKEIVRNNRDGSELNIIDIDENNLDDVILQDTRVFKLQGNLVNLLSENKKISKLETHEIIEPNYEEELEDVELNYEDMYNKSVEKIEELVKEKEELTEKLEKYQSIINKIKEIVE